MLSSTAAQKQATIFGINLENGRTGAVYMPSGSTEPNSNINLAAELFVDQRGARTRSVDSFPRYQRGPGLSLFHPQFANQMDSLIERLRAKNPNAKILLTNTP